MKNKNMVPPADIILGLLNDEENSGDKVLHFYDSYILEVAKEPHYNSSGEYVGRYINNDLAQDIRIAVFNCFSPLRKAFFKKFFSKSPVVVVITHEESE